ncbi:MAG: DEAD/DEAH box helicase [Acidobacteriia bacterium]|nr:DEAD/DEAH box helicase [Terriglobia bacterium]
MSEQAFDRLAPFIQEYIYNHQWTELHAIQVEACRVVFETDAHLLLATGTASGKTEAAFLPVLTLLQENPANTIGVLYIGPLKALINDQFLRLNDLLKEANIPVWAWHGDVSPSQKHKLLKQPMGVLQITPESLESLLINRAVDLVRMFGDLRFVIIDEVHALMSSDRGRQVLCQLLRLSKFIREQPRRIGLSATLGDYGLAEHWLGSGTSRAVLTPKIDGVERKIRLTLEHFYLPPEDSPQRGHYIDSPNTQGGNPEVRDGDLSETDPYHGYIFEHSKGRKCLIFANSRGETESIIGNLRRLADVNGLPDIYFVHHGSISAPLREAAELAMREPDRPTVTAATVTLELGIDVGQLDRIIQLNAPHSVSSFVQRLGRSGRRGNPSEMWFVCSKEEPSGKQLLPAQLPWQLLQCIATIELYLTERWIEPIPGVQLPFSLLYHQTMSILASAGELSPLSLEERVLSLSPFDQITRGDFKELLLHLIGMDHIQRTDEGGLIIGLSGERIVRNFHFYAVFPDNEEFTVREESSEIGSIISPPPPGERFGLAGRTWEVVEIDLRRKTVFAKQVKGKVTTYWSGGGIGNIHSKILKKMRQILFDDNDYSYLQKGAKKRLSEARHLARNLDLDSKNMLPLGGDTYCIFPWMGTIGYRTLERFLKVHCKESLGISSISGQSPYFMTFELRKERVTDLYKNILLLAQRGIDPESLVSAEEAPQLQKYDEFVPASLLRKAFVTDYLNVKELVEELQEWHWGDSGEGCFGSHI